MKASFILFSLFLAHSALVASDRKENTIILDKISVENLKIKSMPAGRQTFESTLFTLGHLEEIPAKRSVLSTRIPGRIVELHTFIGDQVEEGQTLAVLESRQPGNPPPRIELKAPQSGTIVETHILKGEPVEPENELLAIADHSKLWAIAHVPETSIPQTPVGTEARIHILAHGSEKITGKIDRFRTEADQENATLDAILIIDNPKGLLRPQMAAEFHFITKRREGILAVPNSAIQGSRTQPIVFVKDFELANAFVKAPVVVGESNDEYTEIIKGLFEGDDVITNGGYALSYAAPDSGVSLKEALDAAHGHEHNEDGSEMTPAQLKAREAEKAAQEGKVATKSDWKMPITIAIGFMVLALVQLFWERKKLD